MNSTKNKPPKRVLQIIQTLSRSGGVESMLMNYYRNIDRDQIQFDFVFYEDQHDNNYINEIVSLGGRVFKLASVFKMGPLQYSRKLRQLIAANGPYRAVHSHTNYEGGVIARTGKKAGIPVRICHSHNARIENRYLRMLLPFFRRLIRTNSTIRLACSRKAGTFLFKGMDFLVFPNAIDYLPYRGVSKVDIERLKETLKITQGALILGHIGRFSAEKNQIFLAGVVEELAKCIKNFVIILVGEGPTRAEVEQVFAARGISSYARFVGFRDDIPLLMKLFDLFLLPSIIEGLGMVLIEAQAAGVNCITSAQVPEESDLGLGLVEFLPLDAAIWAKSIKASAPRQIPGWEIRNKALSESGYDIYESSKKLLDLYMKTGMIG